MEIIWSDLAIQQLDEIAETLTLTLKLETHETWNQ